MIKNVDFREEILSYLVARRGQKVKLFELTEDLIPTIRGRQKRTRLRCSNHERHCRFGPFWKSDPVSEKGTFQHLGVPAASLRNPTVRAAKVRDLGSDSVDLPMTAVGTLEHGA